MRDKDVNKFLRAAEQRLVSAEILFNHEMYLDCMYVAGYSPDCALKALILSRMPIGKRREYARKNFHGATAHNYEYLKNLLRQLHVNTSSMISAALRKIASWSTDLRYEVGRRKPREASDFLRAARTVVAWCERSI